MNNYYPEGTLIGSPENTAAMKSIFALQDSLLQGKILEARAVVCDNEQHRRDCRHRNKRGIGHEYNEYEQKYDCVNHARNRRASTAFDIGRGSRDSAGGGNASEERGTNVADTLSHKLHIGAVTGVDHSVCDNAGEK